MKFTKEETGLFVLKGKEKKNVFADECDKKKLLDIVQQVKLCLPFKVYAYCVLDSEARFIFKMPAEAEEEILCDISDDFTAYYRLNREIKGSVIREARRARVFDSPDKLKKGWLELHNLPVKKEFVKRAPDYWWSSYQDYSGKYLSGIVSQEPMLHLLDENIEKARKKFSCYYKKR